MRTREITLHHNRPQRIAGTATLECLAGRVWLTRTDAAGDVFLHAGDRYAFDWPDMVLVEALGRPDATARLLLRRPLPLPRRLWGWAGLVLSSMHERMRALRRVGRRGPLAG